VTGIADFWCVEASDHPATGGIAMNIDKPSRGARIEGVLRGMLGFALLVAAAWALANGGGSTPPFDLVSLTGR
jgi:hypothetical protein